MIHPRLVSALILVLQTDAIPQTDTGPKECERFALGSITEAELVERFGAPCFVEVSWQNYKEGPSLSHRLVYVAVCGVSCPQEFVAGFCHDYAPKEVLLGPLGTAHQATFVVREGVVAHAEWEYTREQVPQARAALLADRCYEVIEGGTMALEGLRASSTCSVSVMEEPQPIIWTMAHPAEED